MIITDGNCHVFHLGHGGYGCQIVRRNQSRWHIEEKSTIKKDKELMQEEGDIWREAAAPRGKAWVRKGKDGEGKHTNL